MTSKRSLNHSGDISQVQGQVVCPGAALRPLAKLIANAHLKKQLKKAAIDGGGKSQRLHRKKKGGI